MYVCFSVQFGFNYLFHAEKLGETSWLSLACWLGKWQQVGTQECCLAVLLLKALASSCYHHCKMAALLPVRDAAGWVPDPGWNSLTSLGGRDNKTTLLAALLTYMATAWQMFCPHLGCHGSRAGVSGAAGLWIFELWPSRSQGGALSQN